MTGLGTDVLTSQGPTKLFGSSSYADFTKPPEIGANTPFTLAWTHQPVSPSGYGTVFMCNFGTAGVDNTFVVFCGTAADVYRFSFGPRKSSGGQSYQTSVGALTNGRLDRFVLVAKAGSQSTTAGDFDLYRNGELMTRNAVATFSAYTAAGARIGARETGGDPFEGAILDLRLWARNLSADESLVESQVDGAVDLYELRRILVPVASAAGSVSLTIQDATHAHAADAQTLTTDSTLAVADAAHAHAADNLVLTSATAIAIQEASHAHAADNLSLTTDSTLAVADAAHAHAADNLTLEALTGTSLVIADAAHAHAADAPVLTLQSWLAVADAWHAHLAEQLTLDAPSGVTVIGSRAGRPLVDHPQRLARTSAQRRNVQSARRT